MDDSQPISVEASSQGWEIAEKYAKTIGSIPASFSSTIRTLMSESNIVQRGDTFEISRNGTFVLGRLLRSASVRAPVHFAALDMHPGKLPPGGKAPSDKELIEIVKPDFIRASIGVVYLYRRIKRMCDEKQFDILAREMHQLMGVGSALGFALPAIGPGVGLLTGAMRHLALALFLSRDEKVFKAYRREMANANKSYDLNAEIQRWGCTHVQIAVKLLQHLGFGLPTANGVSFGLGAEMPLDIEKDPANYQWYVTRVWMESLLKTGKAPDITHKGRYYPVKEDLAWLEARVKTLVKDDKVTLWMEKKAEDITSLLAQSKGTPVGVPDDGLVGEAAQEIDSITEAMEELE